MYTAEYEAKMRQAAKMDADERLREMEHTHLHDLALQVGGIKKHENAEKADLDLEDVVKDYMAALEKIIAEYCATYQYVDSPSTEQERDMLIAVFQEQMQYAKQAISDWEESIHWKEWHQVGGGFAAHVEGATFCKADRYGYEFVEIINLEAVCGKDDGPYPDGVYAVSTGYVDREDLEGERAESAKRSWGMGDEYVWEKDRIAQAIFESYGGDYQGSFHTLKEAMKDEYIPAEALWNVLAYDEKWEEEKEKYARNKQRKEGNIGQDKTGETSQSLHCDDRRRRTHKAGW